MSKRQSWIEALEARRLLTFPIAFGSTAADGSTDVAADRAGNVLVVGSLATTADVDPSSGVANLPGGGGFVAKYNNGALVWARQFPGAQIVKVTTDAANSVYLAGTFTGTVDFDPRKGVHNLSSRGGNDAFVCKLSTNGNFLMVSQFGGKGDDVAGGLAVDTAGNMWVGGTFSQRCNFDPNGTFTIGNSGGADGFIVALTSAGVFRWAGSFSGAGDDTLRDLALDGSDNVIATGRYFGSVDFDPSNAVSSANVASTQQAYVLKWDSNGHFVFGAGLGGNGVTFGKGVAADRDGNVLATGNFTLTADFDPSGGTFNLVAPATGQVYVAKFSAAGALVWAKAIGGSTTSDIGPGEIAVDKGRNVYISGAFSGTQDFDPNAGTQNLSTSGQDDVFISKLDGSGNFVFAKSLGGTLEDVPSGMILDRSGNIVTTGVFAGTSDFDPGPGTINFTSNGDTDVFVSKLDANGVLA
jgi:hypothetical protein